MQYKLKKRYPSLPESWKVGDTVTKYFNYYKHDRMGMSSNTIFATEVENYPTFWEKVPEKEYKILTLITNVHDRISDFSDASEDYLKVMLKDKDNVSIYSVKRLSDGEVFTIGDRIRPYSTDEGFIIRHMRINNLKQIVFFNDSRTKTGSLSSQKVKLTDDKVSLNNVVITAGDRINNSIDEDGVAVYEGDRVYVINPNFSIGFTGKLKFEPSSSCFSTKEAAEEYILMNKPCLSINDIKYWLERHRVYSQDKISMTSFIDKLKQTINDK